MATRQIGKLTTIRVRNAKARGLYGDGGGLFLQVGATGGKSWIFRWKQAGKFRLMGLGPCTPSASPKRATWRSRAASCASKALTLSSIAARSGRISN
jgi:hypothetical protein